VASATRRASLTNAAAPEADAARANATNRIAFAAPVAVADRSSETTRLGVAVTVATTARNIEIERTNAAVPVPDAISVLVTGPPPPRGARSRSDIG